MELRWEGLKWAVAPATDPPWAGLEWAEPPWAGLGVGLAVLGLAGGGGGTLVKMPLGVAFASEKQ